MTRLGIIRKFKRRVRRGKYTQRALRIFIECLCDLSAYFSQRTLRLNSGLLTHNCFIA